MRFIYYFHRSENEQVKISVWLSKHIIIIIPKALLIINVWLVLHSVYACYILIATHFDRHRLYISIAKIPIYTCHITVLS